MSMAGQEGHRKPYPRSVSEHETASSDTPSHGISINLPDAGTGHHRPSPVKYMSAPAYQSPIRHHRRTPSKSKGVKETLNARSHYGSSDDDGASVHRINQYIIKQEIGRGSFGAVHLAVDQFGHEYAVKEFSKSRLRKRAQSNLLRKPNASRRPGHLAAGLGFNSPLHRLSSSDKLNQQAGNDSLNLIKEEIAIMKKLNHNNLVSLIEVLDDPQEDSLYMVLEMCKKGVVMKVGLDERAEPYEEETCRCWFRDMILGIEYLHAQGVVHRDIKPDNCLITADDVLKIVDFGVSEMFEKQSEMATAKSAGSPAFMPPELCVAKHGQVSGRAADIWSMGITLYCLRYGHIPFEKTGMLDLYESIREDEVPLDEEKDKSFEDLIRRLLEKNPDKRITMDGLREHPWVTKNGTDPLLSAEENCADLVDPPTEAEMDHAITGNMEHLMVVMRAVKRFKHLLMRKRQDLTDGIFGRESRLVAPPHSIREGKSRSTDAHDRKPLDSALAAEGVHRNIDAENNMSKLPRDVDEMSVDAPPEMNLAGAQHFISNETEAHVKQREETSHHHPRLNSDPEAHRQGTARHVSIDDHAKGHAHDPLTDTLYLDIGAHASSDTHTPMTEGQPPIVSESPPAVEDNIYEQAYQDEMKRIMERKGKHASMFLNRRVEHREDIRAHSNILDSSKEAVRGIASRLGGIASHASKSEGGGGLAALVRKAQGGSASPQDDDKEPEESQPDLPQSGSSGSDEPSTGKQTAHALGTAVARLDAQDGSMPGVPGGFPASLRSENETTSSQ